MQYKIHSVRVKNFKCFDNSKFFEFKLQSEKSPIILTGPNGFGKTTFFDALDLLFSKKITRFETKIENKSTNLQKNVLLNKAESDGYIITTLVNENRKYLSIFAKIDHNMRKVSYDSSIEFGVFDNYIVTDNLENYLKTYNMWKSSLDEFGVLKYSPENFDVYYYVSQAESVHFLKKTISERKDAINTLLDLGEVADWQTYIQSKLIGTKINTPNVIINEEIKALEEKIRFSIIELKKHTDMQRQEPYRNYESILSLNNGITNPYWNEEKLNKYTTDELENGIKEVNRLSSYAKDKGDYDKLQWNNKIDLSTRTGIKDIPLVLPYMKDNFVNKDKINDYIKKSNEIIEIYNKSAFFRADNIKTELFKISNMERIKEIAPDLITFNIQEASLLCEKIANAYNRIDIKQKVFLKMENARESLQRIKNECNSESANCPYCGYKYKDINLLNSAFAEAKTIFENDKEDTLKSIIIIESNLENMIKQSRNKIRQMVSNLSNNIAKKHLETISYLTELVGNEQRIKNVEFIYSIISKESGWEGLEANEKEIEIQRICATQKKKYTDELFIERFKEYRYDSIKADYNGIVLEEQTLLVNEKSIENKILFIRAVIDDQLNKYATQTEKQLKDNLIRKHKLINLRNNFDGLYKVYDKAIITYKNQVLEKLRVPLLIYTGKILQDYQNGLGVFISKDEMRFVTNGDAKHDILNTFSSGQLSGFVLAFLFAMNKQYIKESDDDLGFLLIDDPVQTMDDINISSMIEVLRNDFSDKQIIISTHETDKENYILYKFYKYNKIGQSFNVKDRLYEV